ncbi:MAG: DUF6485 family protein [Dehalococcoidales bacterium]|nr:DUF6485 family protein [Dehalococcoidales bacterium]
MDCNIKANMARCNCTYEPCPRKGKCCECIAYHRQFNELPACFFPAKIEKTGERSYRRFAEWVLKGK